MRKNLVVLLFMLSTVAVFSQDSKFYFKTSLGYSFNSAKFRGVATDIGVGYNPLKYFGFELAFNNMYQYTDDIDSYVEVGETNTGLSLVLHAYPLQLKRHVVDLNVGFGLNMNYWIDRDGYKGLYRYKVPVYGAAYYYRFVKFDLGFVYRYQVFNSGRKMEYHQYLIGLKKRF